MPINTVSTSANPPYFPNAKQPRPPTDYPRHECLPGAYAMLPMMQQPEDHARISDPAGAMVDLDTHVTDRCLTGMLSGHGEQRSHVRWSVNSARPVSRPSPTHALTYGG